MTYYVFLTIIALFIVFLEMYFLGKYISIKNKIFKDNGSASFLMGALLYFTITFFVFFFFIWLDITILYYTIIFFIKDAMLVAFLVTRRQVFSKMKVNWVNLSFALLTTLMLPLIYRYSFDDMFNLSTQRKVNDFQSWFIIQDVIGELFNFSKVEVSDGFSSGISSLIIYNSITSFIIAFSKKKNLVDYIMAVVLSIGLPVLFSFGYKLDSIAPIFLLLFALLLCINVIQKSRRRYALLLGMLDITIWFFNPRLFLAVILMSLITMIIYTFMNKDKAALFWVQLGSPLLALSALWLSEISTTWAIVSASFSALTYGFMVGVGRLNMLDRINYGLSKIRYVIPFVVFLGLFIPSIIILFTEDRNIHDSFLFENAIWQSFGNDTWDKVQSYAYYGVAAIVLSMMIYYVIFKVNFYGSKKGFLISGFLLFIGYSFIFYIISYNGIIADQFEFLRAATFMPLTLMLFTFARRKVGRLNVKKY